MKIAKCVNQAQEGNRVYCYAGNSYKVIAELDG